MRKVLFTYLSASLLLAILAMILVACGGGGDGSGSGTTPTPTPTKSVVITGTVPGTVAIAYDLATGKEAARSVASGTPKTFSLSVDPGDYYYLMFISNEGTTTQRSFAFRSATGGNVFACKANTTLDLGVLVFNNYPGTAVPLIDPITGNDNVAETFMPEAGFSPGAGEWIAIRKFVNSTCPGHSPGTTVTENVTIAQGFGIVTFTPAGTTETAIGVANVNTAILTASDSALVTIYLTMQSDGSLAGTYSKVGYGGECSEDATITAALSTPLPTAGSLSVTTGETTWGLYSTGTAGGPFSPASISYMLTNTGGTSINWTAGKTQTWVTLSSLSGTLAAGASATVTVSFNSGANSLVAGSYSDTVTFTNTTNGTGNTTRPVTLIVTGPTYMNISGKWQFTTTATSTTCSPTLPPPDVSVVTIVQNGNVVTIGEVPGMSGTINGNVVHISGLDSTVPGEPANVTIDLKVEPYFWREMKGTYITVELNTQCQIRGNAVAVKIP